MFEYRIGIVIVALSTAFGWPATSARAAVQYNIVALDVLPGTVDSLALGLNDVGHVVGASLRNRSGNVGQSRPVVWDYSGQPHELWSDQSVGGSLADINNAGEIVGRYGSGSDIPLPGPGVPYGRALYWNSTIGRQDIGFEPVGNSQAVAINELGQVVGTSERLELVDVEGDVPTSLFIPHPFIWDAANGIRDLGTLGGYGGFATAINNLGQVVGYADLANGEERAFVWDQVRGIRELPTIAGGSTRAAGINDLGQVLGGEFGVGPFIWDDINGIQTIPIGGYALNNLGQVVGGSVGGLALWDQTNGVRYLANLIPADSGWQLEIPFAINDVGQIVGYGLLNGKLRGFLMTPVPEPQSLVVAMWAFLLASASIRGSKQEHRLT